MNSNSYWKSRAMAMEESKEAQAERLSKRTAKAYRRVYKRLVKEIDALYAEILDKDLDAVTRTDIYNLYHYKEIANKIAEEVQGLAKVEVETLTALLESISFETYKANYEQFGIEFSVVSEQQAKAVVSENWTGVKFSDRIWGNAEHFNARVMTDIEDMIIGGKQPNKVKRQIMKDFNSKWYEADRLIRTEASHVYNTAAINSYKDAGCEFVDYLAEKDCCDLCEPYSGQRYPIDNAPTIPVHPNCRCTYLPVVEL